MEGFSFPVYLGLTCLLMGFAAYMTGQAIASTWRPVWQLAAYCLLLGAADRFLTFALFEGALLSGPGYFFDTATLLAIALVGFRLRRAKWMAEQYPWLVERTSPLTWREKG